MPAATPARLGASLWIFSAATALSITGTVIQKVAIGWSVWEATRTTTWLAAATAADLLPTLILSIPAGALVDRFRPATTFWISQVASCLQALTLCVLAASHHLTIGRLLLCAIFIGICNAFTVPSRLAYMTQLTPSECFPRAVVLYSLGGNAAFFAGPIIAGFLISIFGATAAYAANALAYLPMIAVAVTLPTAVDPRRIEAQIRESVMREIWAGLKYATMNRPILTMLLSFAAVALTARGIMELSPSIATTVLHGGLKTLSLLMSSFAVGALVAGVIMARWADWGARGTIITTLTGTALALIGYGASGRIAIALMSAVILGFMVAANNISVNTAIQLHSEPRYRGRISSFYNMIFKGGPAISALVFGWLANLTNVQLSSVAAAGMLIVSMLWIARQTTVVRRVGSALTKFEQSA
jgi:MFS family permease